MQADYEREKPRVLPWLLGVIAGVFVLQLVMSSPWVGPSVSAAFLRNTVLSIEGIRAGKIWTLLTYPLVHHDLLEIICLLLVLYWLGRELEAVLGARRLLGLFAGALVVGGLCWVGVHWWHGGSLTGAFPGLCGLLVFYACLYPTEPMRLLLAFIIPVSITPRQLVLVLLMVDGFAFVFYECLGGTIGFAYAPSAHLGGMAMGWLCHRLWRGQGGSGTAFTLPHWGRNRSSRAAVPAEIPVRPVSAIGPEDLRAEVDRILDKINAGGFGTLTAAEKRTLDEAKDFLSRR